MKMFTRNLILLVALLLSVAGQDTAHAITPATLDYQGFLTNNTGVPVNGTVNITFGLYDVGAGGLPLWTATQAVSVSHGVFSVQIGDPLIPFPVSWFENPLWLGIAVEGDAEMFPRRPLNAVGFAYLSQHATNDADTLGELNCAPDEVAKSGGGATWTCAPDNIGSSDWSNLTNVPAGFADDVDNDSGGDITAVNAGAGLTGGSTSGDANLSVLFAGSGAVASAAHSDHNHDNVYYTQAQVNALLANLATQINAQQLLINTLISKLQYVSVSGTQMYITGANLHIRNNSGSTDGPADGLGNLIIGYNESRGAGLDLRAGSHNLVIGSQNNYGSYGGMVLGHGSAITGAYASVSGGGENTASGAYSSVSGGWRNTASAMEASVSGGQNNTASGLGASVSGGGANTASGGNASVSGGGGNIASGALSSVLGGGGERVRDLAAGVLGDGNESFAQYSVVVGGMSNWVGAPIDKTGLPWILPTNRNIGNNTTVSGGFGNTSSGAYASVSGGQYNTASALGASVSGGYENTASGRYASVSGGEHNEASGEASTVAGGGSADSRFGNTAFSNFSAIIGGKFNKTGDPVSGNHTIGENATISGGDTNSASGHTSTVSGGLGNTATGYRSMISGGQANTTAQEASTVVGGEQNSATGHWSTVSGGLSNTAVGDHDWCGGPNLGACAP